MSEPIKKDIWAMHLEMCDVAECWRLATAFLLSAAEREPVKMSHVKWTRYAALRAKLWPEQYQSPAIQEALRR